LQHSIRQAFRLRNFGIYRKAQAKFSAQLKIAWKSSSAIVVQGKEEILGDFSNYRRLTLAASAPPLTQKN
jgi:hypothetical protein